MQYLPIPSKKGPAKYISAKPANTIYRPAKYCKCNTCQCHTCRPAKWCKCNTCQYQTLRPAKYVQYQYLPIETCKVMQMHYLLQIQPKYRPAKCCTFMQYSTVPDNTRPAHCTVTAESANCNLHFWCTRRTERSPATGSQLVFLGLLSIEALQTNLSVDFTHIFYINPICLTAG